MTQRSKMSPDQGGSLLAKKPKAVISNNPKGSPLICLSQQELLLQN